MNYCYAILIGVYFCYYISGSNAHASVATWSCPLTERQAQRVDNSEFSVQMY